MKTYIQTEDKNIIKASIEFFDNCIEIDCDNEVFLNPSKFLYIDGQIVENELAKSPLFQVPWHVEEKAMRIYISDSYNTKLSIKYPEFGLWFKIQENPIIKIDGGCVVYLNSITNIEMNGNIIPIEVIENILTEFNITIEKK